MEDWQIFIYMPAYNAEKTIGELIRRIDRVAKKISKKGLIIKNLIIINDGGNDRTEEVVRESAFSYIKLINKEKNEGVVAALFDGMKEVSELMTKPEKSIVMRMDADLEHQPEDIEKLITPVISDGNKITVGYIPFDSRSGNVMEEFNKKTGIEQSSKFLGVNIPQFCPGFIAVRGDLFLKICPLLVEKAGKFREKYGKNMISMDFVSLVIAKKLGEMPVAVKLSPIEDRYIKKQPKVKLQHYLDCHKKTMEFLES